MDEAQGNRLNTKRSRDDRFELSNLHSFVTNFQQKVCESVEKHFKPWKSDDNGSKSDQVFHRSNGSGSSAKELTLEKQLLPWKRNPAWVDHPPDIKVDMPTGSICNLNLKINVGLPPEAVYNILTDTANKRVFRHIKEVISRKVLIDDGSRQVVELEQAAFWKFLCFSGTVSVHVLIDQNRQDCTMKFKQLKSGFMRRFEGCWKVEPVFIDQELCHPIKPDSSTDYVTCTKGRGRIASKVSLEQLVQLAFAPPVISWYLGGITSKNTETLVDDMCAEAARIRHESSSGTSHQPDEKRNECQVGDVRNIKHRWYLRRTHARQHRRRLSTSKPTLTL